VITPLHSFCPWPINYQRALLSKSVESVESRKSVDVDDDHHSSQDPSRKLTSSPPTYPSRHHHSFIRILSTKKRRIGILVMLTVWQMTITDLYTSSLKYLYRYMRWYKSLRKGKRRIEWVQWSMLKAKTNKTDVISIRFYSIFSLFIYLLFSSMNEEISSSDIEWCEKEPCCRRKAQCAF
jgi:hypothetical protein